MLATPSAGTLALAAGTTLALGAALVVLAPLWREEEDDAPATGRASPVDLAVRAESEQGSAVEALREIEFDRATGKLSDADYAALKAAYTRDALAELRAASPADPTAERAADADSDPVEAALAAYRARRDGRAGGCPVHGARPEVDATFCSDCGRFLAGCCPACGADCEETEQRFCAACGHSLAAPELEPAGV